MISIIKRTIILFFEPTNLLPLGKRFKRFSSSSQFNVDDVLGINSKKVNLNNEAGALESITEQ